MTQLQSVVIFVKSVKRVATFYSRVLGLDAIEQSPSHQLLRGNGIEIVVHAIPRRIAATITIERPPRLRDDTPIKPVFVVADLDAARIAAQASGGAIKPADAAWHFRGATVIDGHDPEGNILQFRQPD